MRIAEGLDRITFVRQFEGHLAQGAIITIDHSKQRVRILPFE